MEWRSTGRPARFLSSFALGLLLLWIIIATLVPFNPPASWERTPTTLREALTLSGGKLETGNVAEHIVSFLPLGLLLHWHLVTRRRRRPMAQALVLVVLIALLLEMGQNIVPSRHGRWSDILVHAVGGVIGIALGAHCRRYRDTLPRFYAANDRVLAASCLLLGNIALVYAVVRSHTGVTLDGWDCGYPLVVANEATGDRPWRGTIRGLAIYDRELAPAEVSSLSQSRLSSEEHPPRADWDELWNEHPARRSARPAVSYAFAGPADGRVPQSAPEQPPLDLMLPQPDSDTWSLGPGGLDVQGTVLVRSDGPAEVVCEAIRRSQAFSLEVALATADLMQEGPARMVSISQDPFVRNLTIGQELGEVDVRIRTPRTGPNGLLIPIRTRRTALAGGRHHLAVSYGNGVVRVFVDGSQARPSLTLYSMSTLLFRREWPTSNGLAAAVMFLPLGVVAAIPLVTCRRMAAYVFGLCVSALLPLAVYVFVMVRLGRNMDWSFAIVAAAVSLLGIALGRRMHRTAPPDLKITSKADRTLANAVTKARPSDNPTKRLGTFEEAQ